MTKEISNQQLHFRMFTIYLSNNNKQQTTSCNRILTVGGRINYCWWHQISYIYLFHPRYLHNDIFRYVTCEITHDISRCTAQAHYPCSYSNRPNFSIFSLPSQVFTATVRIEPLTISIRFISLLVLFIHVCSFILFRRSSLFHFVCIHHLDHCHSP